MAFLVFLLPWRLAFRGIRFLTRYTFFQVSSAASASGLMERYGFARPYPVRLFALHRLVDMADFFLTMKVGRSWLDRNVLMSGADALDKLSAKNIFFVTFHYGQGFWALKYLRDKGLPVAWLHAPPPVRPALGEIFIGWLGRRRIRQVARLCGASAIPVGGSVASMRERLCRDRLPVMVMPDAPLQPGQSSLPVTLFGREARLPAGALRMAAREAVPVIVYSISVNPVDGKRHMRFEGPFTEPTAESLAQRLCDHLQSAIEKDPTAWHVWPWVEGFFAKTSTAGTCESSVTA